MLKRSDTNVKFLPGLKKKIRSGADFISTQNTSKWPLNVPREQFHYTDPFMSINLNENTLYNIILFISCDQLISMWVDWCESINDMSTCKRINIFRPECERFSSVPCDAFHIANYSLLTLFVAGVWIWFHYWKFNPYINFVLYFKLLTYIFFVWAQIP